MSIHSHAPRAMVACVLLAAGCGTVHQTPSPLRGTATVATTAKRTATTPSQSRDCELLKGIKGNGTLGTFFTTWEYGSITFEPVLTVVPGYVTYKWSTNGFYLGRDDQPKFRFAPRYGGEFFTHLVVTNADGCTDEAMVRIIAFPNNPVPTPFPPFPPIPPIPPHAYN